MFGAWQPGNQVENPIWTDLKFLETWASDRCFLRGTSYQLPVGFRASETGDRVSAASAGELLRLGRGHGKAWIKRPHSRSLRFMGGSETGASNHPHGGIANGLHILSDSCLSG